MSQDIYNLLVEHDKDLVGMIAYCIYKQHKQDYIERYKKENQVDEIPLECLETFKSISSTQTSLTSYKTSAEVTLNILLEAFSHNLKETYKQEDIARMSYVLTNHLNPLHDELKRKKSWKAILSDSIIGVVGVSTIFIIVGFLIKGYEYINTLLK